MITPVQLKPCPFCGARAKMRAGGEGGPHPQNVSCWSSKCPSEPTVTGDSAEDAAERWNTRATIPTARLNNVQADAEQRTALADGE